LDLLLDILSDRDQEAHRLTCDLHRDRESDADLDPDLLLDLLKQVLRLTLEREALIDSIWVALLDLEKHALRLTCDLQRDSDSEADLERERSLLALRERLKHLLRLSSDRLTDPDRLAERLLECEPLRLSLLREIDCEWLTDLECHCDRLWHFDRLIDSLRDLLWLGSIDPDTLRLFDLLSSLLAERLPETHLLLERLSLLH